MISSEHSVADTTLRYLRKLPPVPIGRIDVAKVQVAERKRKQFQYLTAIERIQAVGKDIYTFSNGRIINLPEKIGGTAVLSSMLHTRTAPQQFRSAC